MTAGTHSALRGTACRPLGLRNPNELHFSTAFRRANVGTATREQREARNKMKKSVWIALLLIITVLVFEFIVGNKNQQIAQLKEQLASTTAAMEQAKQQLASVSKKRSQPEPLPASSPVESAPMPASAPSPVPQAGAGAATNFMAGLAGMMKNPQIKEVVPSREKMNLERTYASLFNNMNPSTGRQDQYA